MKKTTEGPEATRSLLGISRDLAFIAAIYLYFVGFVYIQAYFGEFGISISSTNFQVYYPIAYSYDVLSKISVVTLLLFLMLATGVAILLSLLPEKIRPHATFLVAILLFWCLGLEAAAKGSEDARAFRTGYGAHTIQLTFRESAQRTLPQKLLYLNSAKKLWLLSQSSARYLVLYQPHGADKELPIGHVFDIPATEVTSARLEVRNDKPHKN